MIKVDLGCISKKIGSSRLFLRNGHNIVVTLLLINNNIVLNVNSRGYLVCSFSCKSKSLKKNVNFFFSSVKITSRIKMKFFNIINKPNILDTRDFCRGQFIKIRCFSKGKKYVSAMKKHNFTGLESTHGVSLKHRSQGSTGQCQDPGRVFKGKKMSGRKSTFYNSFDNLNIVDINDRLNILVVRGIISGNNLCNVYVTYRR